jgi:hypothetical protein
MKVIGGLVTLKPIGGVVSNNQSLDQAQAKIEAKQAQRQSQVDAIVNQMAAKHEQSKQTTSPTDKKWSVKF